MNLEFKRFQNEHYPEYASWFSDPELNRHLGPMDVGWLEAVLSQAESEGRTWSVFRDVEFVAVIETVFDEEHRWSAGITALATKPGLRRQGIGATVLQTVIALHRRMGILEHFAFISIHNEAGQRCALKAGFRAVTSQPDERGYIEFRHHASDV
jgi:RimJ/RimL family protein N-acetyltransferase